MADNTANSDKVPEQGAIPAQGQNLNNQATGVSDDALLRKDEPMITDNQDATSGTPSEPQIMNQEVQGEQQSQGSENWEASSKYFQSEKDKVFEENKQLNQDIKKYKALGEFVDGRPDVQEYLNGQLEGGQPTADVQKPSMATPPEDFDPWDAYNDPTSDSFKFRSESEQNNLQTAMKTVKEELVGQYETERKLSQFDKELGGLGLNDSEKESFYQFANTPVAKMGTEQLVSMWRATGQSQAPSQGVDPSIDATRRNQQVPSGAGVLQGNAPQAPVVNETDVAWDSIMNAARKSKMELK